MFVDIKSSIKSTIYDFHLLHPRQWFGNIYAACLNEKEKKKWKTKILFLKIGWSPKRSRQRYALNRRRKRSSFAQLFQIILPPSFHAYLSRQIIDIHAKQIGLAGEIYCRRYQSRTKHPKVLVKTSLVIIFSRNLKFTF